MSGLLAHAEFVERPNRFLVRARLDDGSYVDAYLPNTGRLEHLTIPGRPLILRRDGKPPRVTEYTVTRAWDGCWVALEASRAPALLRDWLQSGNPLGDFGEVLDVQTEVRVDNHRLDLRVMTPSGAVWVEVKSGGRAEEEAALLSKTPSARGVAHLKALETLVEQGERAAAAFVVQRGDVRRLRVGGDADPGWIEAVRHAHDGDLPILAYGCDVTETDVRIARQLPLVFRP